jgi:hypothetical protein
MSASGSVTRTAWRPETRTRNTSDQLASRASSSGVAGATSTCSRTRRCGLNKIGEINALCDVLNVDMARYWTPTRETYLNHVSKARIVEVVANAMSPEAAAPFAAMKKGEAAAAAEIRLSESGWIPEVLTNREAATVHSYEIEDEDANEVSAEEDTDEV